MQALMTEDKKESQGANEVVTAPKKKLTLKLSKTTDSDPISEKSTSEGKTSTRAAVFNVPAQQRNQYAGMSRDRRPSMSFEERRNRLDMLKNAERSKSSVNLQALKPTTTFNKHTNKKPVKHSPYAQKDNNRGNKFRDNPDRDSRLNIGMGVVQTLSGDFNVERESGWRKVRNKKEQIMTYKPSVVKTIEVYDGIPVQLLQTEMAISARDLNYKMRQLGISAKLTDELDTDSAEMLVIECGHNAKRVAVKDVNDDPISDVDLELKARPPIVTIVGHVDHGKTSLLDKIRKTNVTAGEAGGITQHIGAYQVASKNGKLITFLDTPGHETFSSMRARGVQLTDIVILVVAADDGIQEQTIEAIKHIKNANVQIIVAVTKIDKPGANPDKVLEMLLAHDIVTEKHSGDIMAVPVSSVTGEGIDSLLNAIDMQADMMNLQARDAGHGIGVVIETTVKKGFGHVANIILQKGVLNIGDNFVVGKTFGKVRCLIDANNDHKKQVGPSTPISVVGLDDAAVPSDRLVVVPNDAMAKATAQARIDQNKTTSIKHKTLDELYAKMNEEKKVNVILKADTVGSVEALKQGVEQIKNDELKVNVIDYASGPVSDSDVLLAEASKSIIISFHNKVPGSVMKLATEKFVHVISETIIYKILEDLQKLIDGMMEPVIEEKTIGKAEIIRLFTFSKGTVAGCKVTDGKIIRGGKMKVIRDGEVIIEGDIKSLQKETQVVKEAAMGQECGIMMADFHKYQIGDVIECYEEVEIKR